MAARCQANYMHIFGAVYFFVSHTSAKAEQKVTTL